MSPGTPWFLSAFVIGLLIQRIAPGHYMESDPWSHILDFPWGLIQLVLAGGCIVMGFRAITKASRKVADHDRIRQKEWDRLDRQSEERREQVKFSTAAQGLNDEEKGG